MRVRKAVAEWPGEDGEDGGRGEAGKGREIHTHPDAQVKSSRRRGGQGCARTGNDRGEGCSLGARRKGRKRGSIPYGEPPQQASTQRPSSPSTATTKV